MTSKNDETPRSARSDETTELTPAAKADLAAAQEFDPAREATQAEAARVAQLSPGSDPASGEAPVEPHTEMFPHQPHGQAGQPQNRPAHEGHQGVTPLQHEDQDFRTGISPVEAVTHGEPSEIVPTEYATRESRMGRGKSAQDAKEAKDSEKSNRSANGRDENKR